MVRLLVASTVSPLPVTSNALMLPAKPVGTLVLAVILTFAPASNAFSFVTAFVTPKTSLYVAKSISPDFESVA